MVPYLGGAQETHQTAPSWLRGSVREGIEWCARVWTAGRQDLPFESFCEAVLVALDLDDLDGLVGGACG